MIRCIIFNVTYYSHVMLLQLNDFEKKQSLVQLIIYADIGNSSSTHAQHAAPISGPYPSLSLQLDDSQVQYADVKPHQSTTTSDIMVDIEAGMYRYQHREFYYQLSMVHNIIMCVYK